MTELSSWMANSGNPGAYKALSGDLHTFNKLSPRALARRSSFAQGHPLTPHDMTREQHTAARGVAEGRSPFTHPNTVVTPGPAGFLPGKDEVRVPDATADAHRRYYVPGHEKEHVAQTPSYEGAEAIHKERWQDLQSRGANMKLYADEEGAPRGSAMWRPGEKLFDYRMRGIYDNPEDAGTAKEEARIGLRRGAQEIPTALGDVAQIAKQHKEVMKRPLDHQVELSMGMGKYQGNAPSHVPPQRFAAGKKFDADWAAQQADKHGFFDGKSMTQLLNTKPGRAWLQHGEKQPLNLPMTQSGGTTDFQPAPPPAAGQPPQLTAADVGWNTPQAQPQAQKPAYEPTYHSAITQPEPKPVPKPTFNKNLGGAGVGGIMGGFNKQNEDQTLRKAAALADSSHVGQSAVNPYHLLED